MLRKNAKIELLRHVPLFSDCSKGDLAKIAMIADEIDLPVGTTLIRENERGRQFFVVVEGTVRVTRKGRKVEIRGGAEFFGEIALVTDTPTIATVTATSDIRALVITERSFRALLRDAPGIQAKVLRSLAARLAPETL